MSEVLEFSEEVKPIPLTSKVVSIEQYFDPEVPNMGLEKYGMSMFENGGISEDLGYKTFGNKIRYVTGLDEHADEIRQIEDPEVREARIEQILAAKKELEKVLGNGTLDPSNVDFWKNIRLDIRERRKYLDLTNPYDLIFYFAIKAGGFTEVAPSFEVARKHPSKTYKFYLQELEEFAAIKTERKKEINICKGKLQEIYTKDPRKLMRIAKLLLNPNNQFKNSTPVDIIYDKLDEFIDGKTVKTNKKATPTQFMEACALDKKTLNIKAVVLDAIWYRHIIIKSDNHYYNVSTGSIYGKNINEIVEYMKNPLNQEEFANILGKIEDKWNK